MPTHHINTNVFLAVILVGCSSPTITNPPAAVGGNSTSSSGGSTSANGGATSSSAGNTNVAGGNTSTNTGGTNSTGNSATANTGSIVTTSGGTAASGGTNNATGGVAATGGSYATGLDGPTGGVSNTGGSKTGGGATNSGGSSTSTTGGVAGTTGGVAGTTGGATGTTGGTSAVDPCSNGAQDNGETGIDCGGSCAACGVTYRVKPPDPCYDQQNNLACFNGTDLSCKVKMGGVSCQIANVCENDTNKIGNDVGFMCSRDIIFSAEMIQAVKDDAKKYSWPNPDDPPFNYAVVGHDSGRLETGLSNACCQCYQLILGNPLNNAPQPPEMPYPKPLIVQAFNTSAGGGDNFDIYLAAGGYGAHNGCNNEPSCGQTHKTYNEWVYTTYVDYKQMINTDSCLSNGGLRYLNVSECEPKVEAPDWTYHMTNVVSDACQNKIADLCNDIVAKSAASTTTARNSCIEANKPDSLYHQNWQNVRAKRVECPEALTRVTGCRLQDQGLPKADPNVKVPTDADSSFGTGFTTTTMEDCCMPTCSWNEEVHPTGGKNPAAYTDSEGTWRSFYTCNSMGEPYTAD